MDKTALEGLAKAMGSFGQHLKKAADFHKAKAAAHEKLAAAHSAHHEFAKARHEGMDDGDANKGYFGKVASLHKAKAEHHAALASLHKDHAAHCDGMSDGLSEEKVQSAFKALLGEPATAAPGTTTAPAPAAGGNGNGSASPAAPKAQSVEDLVKETTTGLVNESLNMLKTDPTVKEEIKKLVLEGVKAALGSQVVPDGVTLINRGLPEHLKSVVRPGQPEPGSQHGAEVDKVAPELQALVQA